MKFRLMDGTHAEQIGYRLPDGRVVEKLERGQEGEPEIRRWQVTRDAAGNIHLPVIETKHDLHEKYDINKDFPAKFQRLPDNYVEPEPVLADQTGAVEGLSAAEVNQLRALMAKAQGVNVVQQAAQAGFNPAISNPHQPPPVPTVGKGTLEAMSFADLKKWADEEEVNLGGAKTKEEALKALRTAGVLK